MNLKYLATSIVTIAGAMATANTRYILRYTESEPLAEFLARYSLVREVTITGRPIHSVNDPLSRSPAELIQRISDDTDDDVSIELDQVVKLPIRSFVRNQDAGLAQLLGAMGRTRPTWFFGSVVPQGFVNQQPVIQIRANTSWPRHGLGTGVVAVIDTGVDVQHPIFKNRLVPGFDVLSNVSNGSELNGLSASVLALINPTTTPLLERHLTYTSGGVAPAFEQSVRNDPRLSSIPFALGHGTMVAGAVVLVAPGTRVMPIRAFYQTGYGRLFNIIRAIHGAEDRGARVVNLSFNFYVYSREFERTVAEVSDRGIILVASTGNDARTSPLSYPAAYDKVTGVASIGNGGFRSLYSNAGPNITWVAAPGEGVLLPFPGKRWAGGWGTSFAAPFVSGLASKLLVRKPNATYSDLQSALGRSFQLGDPNLGLGLLDVWNSVEGQ